jgi:hypothetical protein
MPVLTDENIQSGEIMTQDKPEQIQSRTAGLELAEREENALGSGGVLLKDGEQFSP